MATPAPMEQLPEEIGLHIFSFLSPQDISKASSVSQQWLQLATDNHVWRGLYQRLFPALAPRVVRRYMRMKKWAGDESACVSEIDWRNEFQRTRETEANWKNGHYRRSTFSPFGFTASVKTVGGMVFQSDEDWLVTGHFNTGDVAVFDNPTEECPRPRQRHCLEYEDRLSALQFSDGLLACGHTDGVVNVWNLTKGEHMVALIRSYEWVESLLFNKPANQLVVGYSTGKVGLWNIEQERVVGQLKGHKANVMCMQLSPDGHIAFTGSLDSSIRIWDVRSEKMVGCIKGERVIKCLCVDFDGHQLVHNKSDTSLSLLDVRMLLSNCNEEQEVFAPVVESWKAHDAAIIRMQIQGHRLATGSRDKAVKVWDLSSPERKVPTLTLPQHADWVTCLQLDGESLRCAGGALIATYYFNPQ